jgi:GT2 family glycosyltransferase
LLFTAGVNAGITRALRQRRESGGGTPHCLIWVLNNDTRVEPDCVRAAVQCFNDMGWAQTAAVGSRNLMMERPDLIAWGGSKECFPAGNHKTGLVSKGDLAMRTEEEWLTFASVFLNRDAVEGIGLLDRNLRHICSDSDYCFRLRAQGWHCYYEPASVVLHAVGTSNRNASMELMGIMRKDAEYFMKKWVRPGLFNTLTQYQLS